MRPYVPSGRAIEMSVSTMALPRAGTVEGREAYRSKPAAEAEPRVGMMASGARRLTRRGWFWGQLRLGVRELS
jgi:hypothetical protein